MFWFLFTHACGAAGEGSDHAGQGDVGNRASRLLRFCVGCTYGECAGAGEDMQHRRVLAREGGDGRMTVRVEMQFAA